MKSVAVALALTALFVCLSLSAAEVPDQVYVPNFTGDVGRKLGGVLASEASVALMEQGIQAFTFKNLSDQLRQEQYKEVLRCEADAGCVDEVVAGFGVANRVFGVITKLSRRKYHVELAWSEKGRFRAKVTLQREVSEDDLGPLVRKLVVELLDSVGAGSSLGVESPEPVPEARNPETAEPPRSATAAARNSVGSMDYSLSLVVPLGGKVHVPMGLQFELMREVEGRFQWQLLSAYLYYNDFWNSESTVLGVGFLETGWNLLLDSAGAHCLGFLVSPISFGSYYYAPRDIDGNKESDSLALTFMHSRIYYAIKLFSWQLQAGFNVPLFWLDSEDQRAYSEPLPVFLFLGAGR